MGSSRHRFSKSSFLLAISIGWFGFSFVTAAEDGPTQSATKNLQATAIRIPAAIVKIADSVNVPVEYGGVLTSVSVTEGQLVQKGQILARVNDTELRLKLTKAQYENQIAEFTAKNDVDIRYSEKSMEVAAADVARSNRANTRVANSVPSARLERQYLEQDRTTLQLEQAKRDFEIAKLKKNLTENEVNLSKFALNKTLVKSPMEGMVVSVEKREGEWVEPSESVVRIVRINRLRVEGFVKAELASQIQVGARANVIFQQPWLKDKTFPGRIVFVSPEANPVSSELIVWAEIQNTDNQLVAGLRGEIVIEPILN